MTKREKMYQQIEKHGNNLLAIFPEATEKDPVKLCKKLFRLENKAHRLTTDARNTGNDHEAELTLILAKVNAILKAPENMLFINGDPRGYALKIRSQFAQDMNIHKDWGGYGILAPDFN